VWKGYSTLKTVRANSFRKFVTCTKMYSFTYEKKAIFIDYY